MGEESFGQKEKEESEALCYREGNRGRGDSERNTNSEE